MFDRISYESPFSAEGGFFLQFLASGWAEREMHGRLRTGESDVLHRMVARAWSMLERNMPKTKGMPAVFHYWYGPLFRALGYSLRRRSKPAQVRGIGTFDIGYGVKGDGADKALVVLMEPGRNPDADCIGAGLEASRLPAAKALRCALEAEGIRWGILCAGPRMRLMDAGPLEFRAIEADIEALLKRNSPAEWEVFRAVFGREALEDGALEALNEAGRNSAMEMSRSLLHAAETALLALMNGCVASMDSKGRKQLDGAGLERLFGECLFVLYRMIFLLFAESRGMLPLENGVYRSGYSFEHLRDLAESKEGGDGSYFWRSLNVLSGLVSGGVSTSRLRIPAYDGRLFSKNETPILSGTVVRDSFVREAVLALSLSSHGRKGRNPSRFSYSSFGVAQLGSIFEGLLTLEPFATGLDGGDFCGLRSRPGIRKEAGAFYTPEWMTSFVVRKTLEPLVRDRTADEILRIRVLDPSMGSGAFLIQALRFLAEAYGRKLGSAAGVEGEAALMNASEHKRRVAESCLYGVDRMPLAVELAKVSVWLETAEAGKPLNFLDHRLRPGNSLVGASIEKNESGWSEIDFVPHGALKGWPLEDRERLRAAMRINSAEIDDVRSGQQLLFTSAGTSPILEKLLDERRMLGVPDDDLRTVRGKQRIFERIRAAGSGFAALRTLLDSWCSLWFTGNGASGKDPPTTGKFRELAAMLLSPRSCPPVRDTADTARMLAGWAEKELFFHWELEFPEVFEGRNPGFDAVVGNPPWEVLKSKKAEFMRSRGVSSPADPEDESATAWGSAACMPDLDARWEESMRRQKCASRWFRLSGKFPHSADGDLNTYKLFLERSFTLLRKGGRMGVVVPHALAADEGAASLRRMLLEESSLEHIYIFDNRKALFPIHRSFKFALAGLEKGGRTERFATAAGLSSQEDLAKAEPLDVEVADVARRSPETLSIMECASEAAASLLDCIYGRSFLASMRDDSWRLSFRTEVGISADSAVILPVGGRRGLWGGRDWVPLCEGKSLWQFRPWSAPPAHCMERKEALRKTGGAEGFKIAFRRIARGTDERMMAACALPSFIPCETNASVAVVEGGGKDRSELLFSLAVLNSLALEYVMKRRAGSTLNLFHMRQAPLPALDARDPLFDAVAALSARLACNDPVFSGLWKSAFKGAWRKNGLESGGWSESGGWKALCRGWKPDSGLQGTDGFGRDCGDRFKARCELDALVALAYGMDGEMFRRLLADFDPLGRAETRRYGACRTASGCAEAHARLSAAFEARGRGRRR